MHKTAFLSPEPTQRPRERFRSLLSAASLPPDVQTEAVRRIQWITLIVSVVGLVGFVLAEFFPAIRVGPLPLAYRTHALILFTSIGLFFVSYRRALPAPRILDLALAYEITGGAALAVVINARPWPQEITPLGWSPVAVWALFFPLLVPSSTARTALAAALTIAMDPLAVWLHTRLGHIPAPEVDALLRRFVPSVIAFLLAIFASRMIHRLGTKLTEARELGSYRLIERLGGGGMGEVWKARHQLLARPAAVKLIRPEGLDDEGSLGAAQRRFEREAQATAALRSPHTIHLFDFGVAQDGSFYYVMELLDGMDLESLVKLDGPQPPERVVHLLRQACHSLHEAHLAGLVHRDIKPANLFVCRYGADVDFVKVLDFGLVAERKADAAPASLTGRHVLTGTPAFMAPELASKPGQVDGRADLYALGCVAYWLLTGKLVFEAETLLQMVMRHMTEAPTPPSAQVDRPIPQALDELVVRCLEKDPARRPRSARDLSDRLSALGLEERWTERRAAEWWEETEEARRAMATAASG